MVDAQIRLWRDGKAHKQLREHTGACLLIRVMCLLCVHVGVCRLVCTYTD